MICARGALCAGGLTVSRVPRVGTIGAVGSRCLRSRDHRRKAGVRPVAVSGLRTRRRLLGRKSPSQSRGHAAAAGLPASARYPSLVQGIGGRPRASGARAFQACRPFRRHAHEQYVAQHRPLDLRALGFLRARARSSGGESTPFAELLGSCHSPWPDAHHGCARATLAHLKRRARS
jgi:hypothetical protein